MFPIKAFAIHSISFNVFYSFHYFILYILHIFFFVSEMPRLKSGSDRVSQKHRLPETSLSALSTTSFLYNSEFSKKRIVFRTSAGISIAVSLNDGPLKFKSRYGGILPFWRCTSFVPACSGSNGTRLHNLHVSSIENTFLQAFQLFQVLHHPRQ